MLIKIRIFLANLLLHLDKNIIHMDYCYTHQVDQDKMPLDTVMIISLKQSKPIITKILNLLGFKFVFERPYDSDERMEELLNYFLFLELVNPDEE